MIHVITHCPCAALKARLPEDGVITRRLCFVYFGFVRVRGTEVATSGYLDEIHIVKHLVLRESEVPRGRDLGVPRRDSYRKTYGFERVRGTSG